MELKRELVEEDGKLLVRGPVGEVDTPLSNGSIIPRAVLEAAIQDFKEKKLPHFGSFFVGNQFPDEMERVRLENISHCCTHLEVHSTGAVMGEFQILDTPKGKEFLAALKAQGNINVGIRGYGSVKLLENGLAEVESGMRVEGYDFLHLQEK